MKRILFTGLLLAWAAACTSNSTPTTPAAPLNVTGKWTGAISLQGISGIMTWQLTQTGSNVTGPVTIALPTGTVLLNGFLTGALTGSSLDSTIAVAPGGIPTQPTCAGQLKGTMTVTATTMNGPVGLSSSNCTSLIATTTVALTKS